MRFAEWGRVRPADSATQQNIAHPPCRRSLRRSARGPGSRGGEELVLEWFVIASRAPPLLFRLSPPVSRGQASLTAAVSRVGSSFAAGWGQGKRLAAEHKRYRQLHRGRQPTETIDAPVHQIRAASLTLSRPATGQTVRNTLDGLDWLAATQPSSSQTAVVQVARRPAQ